MESGIKHCPVLSGLMNMGSREGIGTHLHCFALLSRLEKEQARDQRVEGVGEAIETTPALETLGEYQLMTWATRRPILSKEWESEWRPLFFP